MKKFLVVRPQDIIEVAILPRIKDGKYSFVNLTKGHICECKFDNIEEAIGDMNKQIELGKVISYKQIITLNDCKECSHHKRNSNLFNWCPGIDNIIECKINKSNIYK